MHTALGISLLLDPVQGISYYFLVKVIVLSTDQKEKNSK